MLHNTCIPRCFCNVLAFGVTLVWTLLSLTNMEFGQDWSGDYALYVMHARNIVQGTTYGDTDFIFTPNTFISPPAYPPGFPLLLAPAYAAFGMDLEIFKVLLVGVFALTLMVIYWNETAITSKVTAFVVTVLVAVNPYVWNYTHNIRSEFPFMLWLYISFLLFRLRDVEVCRHRQLALSTLAGFTCYFAYATRTIGLAVLIALLIRDSFHWRDLLARSGPTVIIFCLGALWQTASLNAGAEVYAHVSHRVLENVPQTVWSWFLNLFGLFPLIPNQIDEIVPTWTKGAIPLFILAMIFTGFAVEKKSRRHADGNARGKRLIETMDYHDWFAAIYVAGHLVSGVSSGTRYALPLLPIMLHYAVRGGACCIARVGIGGLRAVAAVGVIALGIHLAYFIDPLPRKPPSGIHLPQSVELFGAVQRLISEDAIIAFRKPRILALLAGRKSTIWPSEGGLPAALRYFDEAGVTHLIVARPESSLIYPEYLRFDQNEIPPYLQRIFENDHFIVFSIDKERLARFIHP